MTRAVVGADPDRAGADPVGHPGDHVAELVERGFHPVLRHEAVGAKTDHAAALDHRLHGRGFLEAPFTETHLRVVFARVRVGDRDGAGGQVDRLARGPLAAVGQVDQRADPVHFRNRIAPEARGDAGILGLPVAGADVVLKVVGQLHDADAELAERLDQLDVMLDGGGVLETHDDRGQALLGVGADVRGRGGQPHEIGVLSQRAPPHAKPGQRLARVFPDRDGDVHARNVAFAPFLEPSAVGLGIFERVHDQLRCWMHGRLLLAKFGECGSCRHVSKNVYMRTLSP